MEGEFKAPKSAEENQITKNAEIISSLMKEVLELSKENSDLTVIRDELVEKEILYNFCLEDACQKRRNVNAKNEERKKALNKIREDAASNCDERLENFDNLAGVSGKAIDVVKNILKPHSMELHDKRKTQNVELDICNEQHVRSHFVWCRMTLAGILPSKCNQRINSDRKFLFVSKTISNAIAGCGELDKQALDMTKEAEMFIACVQQVKKERDDLLDEAQIFKTKSTLAYQELQDLQQRAKKLEEEVTSLHTKCREIKTEIEYEQKKSKTLNRTLKLTRMKFKKRKTNINSISMFLDENSPSDERSAVTPFKERRAAILQEIDDLEILLARLDTSDIDKRLHVASQEAEAMLALYDSDHVLTETGCSTKSQLFESLPYEQITKIGEELKQIQSEYEEKLQSYLLNRCQIEKDDVEADEDKWDVDKKVNIPLLKKEMEYTNRNCTSDNVEELEPETASKNNEGDEEVQVVTMIIEDDVAADEDQWGVVKEENIQPLEVENGNWSDSEEELEPGTANKNNEGAEEVQIVTMLECGFNEKLSETVDLADDDD